MVLHRGGVTMGIERRELTERIIVAVVCPRLTARYRLTCGKLTRTANGKFSRCSENSSDSRGREEEGVD
jgi:hypothetical protein